MNLKFNYFLLFILFSSVVVDAQEFSPLVISNDELSWKKLSEKIWFAQITGKEDSPGMYVYRVRFEKGHRNEPHYHTDERVITVLSGSVYVGFGESFKESDMKKISAGGVYTEPKKVPHYVWAKDESAVLQVVGSGSSQRISVQYNR